MLSHAVAGDRIHPAARRHTLRRAWRPCARALPLPTLAAIAGLAAAPSAVVLLRGGHSFGGALVAAALAFGASTAFALEDPAEETLSASPTPLAHRRLLRLAAIVLGVAVLSGLLLLVAASSPGGLTAGAAARRAAELAAASGLAGAVAGMARRQGAPWAAHGGATAGLLVVLVITSFAYRYRTLPALVDSPHHARWWLVGLVGWLVACWTWRDPGRR